MSSARLPATESGRWLQQASGFKAILTPRNAGEQGRRDYAPQEMLRMPTFWLLFAMMTMMSTSGLMVVAQSLTIDARAA